MGARLRSWMIELRAPFLTATLVSIVLGTAIAWARDGVFHFGYFMLALLGGAFLHLGTNIANDYYDHKSGNDEVNKEFVRPFSGGSRTIQLGLLEPKEVLLGALLFYGLAASIGLYVAWVRGPFVLALGLIGLISGFFYVAPPLNWVSRGVGEALVGLNFGALMTLGAYYVQTLNISFEPLISSLPISLLIAAVLYINEFPDYAADKAVGKDTLVVRLGRSKAAYGYALIVLGAYFFIFVGVLLRTAPLYALFGFITLPLALEAIRHALRFHSQPFNLIPANAMTIVLHFITGLLISFGYLLSRFETMSPSYIFSTLLVVVSASFTGYFYLKMRKARKRWLISQTPPS